MAACSALLLAMRAPLSPEAGLQGPAARVASILSDEAEALDSRAQRELALHIVRVGEHYAIDPLLILALIKVESGFQPRARSPKGALGLMQVMPIVLRDVGDELSLPTTERKLLMDPYQNIVVGVHYLSKLLQLYRNNLNEALTAYNLGPTLLDEYHQEGRSAPRGYSRKIQQLYARWRRG